MRPRIGITAWHRPDKDGLERWEAVRSTYTAAVLAAGGLPLILPIASAESPLLAAYLAAVDGLLFSGGEDVDPAHYGERLDPRCGAIDPERDAFELALARAALTRGVPTLGICRGLQLLNVAAGGSLYQDLACRPGTLDGHDAPHAERRRLAHPVVIRPGSRLHAVLGLTESPVTSTHHQAVKGLAPGFTAGAECPEDGLVEAVEDPSRPFLLAVQWHPERMAGEHPAHLALFRWLVEAARGAAEGRGQ